MRSKFLYLQQYTEEDYKLIWSDCYVVFDTNVLLDLYRYSRETSDQYIKVFSDLRNRGMLFLPHQIGLEFHKSRYTEIIKYKGSYEKIVAKINKFTEELNHEYKRHPYLIISDIIEQYRNSVKELISHINKIGEEYPNLISNDIFLDKLNHIFDGVVGDEFSKPDLDSLCKDGEERYKNKIPPGFKDINKGGTEQYGDLIIWKQMIKKAKEAEKNILFVSNDAKDDWMLKIDGKNLMPLPELKKEFFEETGKLFHIYKADRFLQYHANKFTCVPPEEAIRETKKLIRDKIDYQKNIDDYSTIIANLGALNLQEIFKNHPLNNPKIASIRESLNKNQEFLNVSKIINDNSINWSHLSKINEVINLSKFHDKVNELKLISTDLPELNTLFNINKMIDIKNKENILTDSNIIKNKLESEYSNDIDK